jgi:hypothetical protein
MRTGLPRWFSTAQTLKDLHQPGRPGLLQRECTETVSRSDADRSAPTVKKIQATLPTKLQVWGPRLVNAPYVPCLKSCPGTRSTRRPNARIRGLDDSLPHRSYVWIPSLKAIVGGSMFRRSACGRDTQTAQRADWNRKLGSMALRHHVPGHLPQKKQDASQLAYTQSY